MQILTKKLQMTDIGVFYEYPSRWVQECAPDPYFQAMKVLVRPGSGAPLTLDSVTFIIKDGLGDLIGDWG